MIAAIFVIALLQAKPAPTGPTFVPPGKTGGVQAYTYSEVDSCGVWTRDRANGGHQDGEEPWLLGFLTGLNLFGPNNGNVAPATKAEGFFVWVDNYCHDHPLDSVTTAAFALSRELAARAQR